MPRKWSKMKFGQRLESLSSSMPATYRHHFFNYNALKLMIRSGQFSSSAQVHSAIFSELERINSFVLDRIADVQDGMDPEEALITVRELVMFIDWNTVALGKLLKKGKRRLPWFQAPRKEEILKKYAFFTTLKLAQKLVSLRDHHSQLFPFCMTCKEHLADGDTVVTSCLHTFCTRCAALSSYCTACSKYCGTRFANLATGEEVCVEPETTQAPRRPPPPVDADVSLLQLPRELLVHIFTFLGPLELVRLEKTCKLLSGLNGQPSIPEEAARASCLSMCRELCAITHNPHHHAFSWKRKLALDMSVSLAVVHTSEESETGFLMSRTFFPYSRHKVTTFPTVPRMASFTHDEDHIYVIGGFTRGSITSCQRIEYHAKPPVPVPTPMPDLLEPRHWAPAVVADDAVYVLGGCCTQGLEMLTLASCEQYNKADNEWTHIAPMPRPRSRTSPALIGDYIYVCGGQTEDSGALKAERSTWQYDIHNNSWTDLKTPSHSDHVGAASAVWHNCLYVFGGKDTTVVEAYDPLLKLWTLCCPMPAEVSGAYAVLIHNYIYIVGGRIKSFSSARRVTNRQVFTYDPRRDSWQSSELPTLTEPGCVYALRHHKPLDYRADTDSKGQQQQHQHQHQQQQRRLP